MGQVFVVKFEEGQKETATFIDIAEILFFGVEDNKLVVHTQTEKYVLPNSLEHCALLNPFERVERGFVANMEQKSHFDSELQLLHFKDSSKTCYVSQNHKNRLKLK